jgi:hypothetical protein
LTSGFNDKPSAGVSGGGHAAGSAPSMGNFVIKKIQGTKKK